MEIVFVAMLTESITAGIIGLVIIIVNVILAVFMYYLRAKIRRSTGEKK